MGRLLNSIFCGPLVGQQTVGNSLFAAAEAIACEDHEVALVNDVVGGLGNVAGAVPIVMAGSGFPGAGEDGEVLQVY